MSRRDRIIRTTEDFLEFFQDVMEFGFDQALSSWEVSRDELSSIAGNMGLSPSIVNLLSDISDFRNTIMEGGANLPEISVPQEIQDGISSLNGLSQELFDQVISRGGASQNSQQLFDRFMDIGRGQTNEQRALSREGFNLLDRGGRSNQTIGLADRGFDLINSFGRAGMPELDSALGDLTSLISERGMTEDIRRALDLGEGMIRGGGFTPQMTSAFNEMLGLIRTGAVHSEAELPPEFRELYSQFQSIIDAGGQSDALLPLGEQVGLAAAEAAQTAGSFQDRLRREAISSGFAGFGDTAVDQAGEIADSVSTATRQARLEAQGLRANQLSEALRGQTALVGAQLDFLSNEGRNNDIFTSSLVSGIGSIINAGSNNISSAANILNQQNSIAAQNLRTGVEGALGIGNLFHSREIAGANMLQNSRQLELQGIGLGANLLGQSLTSRIQGLGAANQIDQQNMQNLLSAIGLSGNLTTTGMNAILQNQGQQLNAGLANQQMNLNAVLQAMGLEAGLATGAADRQMQAAIGLGNLSLPFIQGAFGMGQAASGVMGQAISGISQPGFWGNLVGGILGSVLPPIGGAAGNLILGSIPGVGGGGSSAPTGQGITGLNPF